MPIITKCEEDGAYRPSLAEWIKFTISEMDVPGALLEGIQKNTAWDGGLAKEFGSKLSDHANKQQEFFNGVKMLTSFGKYEWQNNFNTLSSISTNLKRAFIGP